MLLNEHEKGIAPRGALAEPGSETRPVRDAVSRHGYAPPAARRVVALGGTGAIYALILAGFFLTIRTVSPPPPPAAPTVLDLRPLSSPQEAPSEEKQAPEPQKEREMLPEPRRVEPVERSVVPVAPLVAPTPVVPAKPDPGPREPEQAAPRTMPAPPSPQASNNAPETWQGRVLAELNKHRRYPRTAQVRRQQGVPWIRFVMDREGKVLSSRLERKSGFADLDREAVLLPKRAQPLPTPPADVKGDTIELVVPVEFFLR